MKRNSIAYFLAKFPSQTETFILKEALYINKSIPLFIIAFEKGKHSIDNIVHIDFEIKVVYIPQWWSWKILLYGILKLNILYREFSFSGYKNSLYQIKILLIASFASVKIKEMQIQHIHAHFANYPTDIAMMVSRLSGISFSFTAHAHDIYVNSFNLSEKIRRATFVTTCTGYNQKWINALATPEEQIKIHLVYHGVNMNFWHFYIREQVEKPLRLLTIGRLVEKKGIVYLLEAVNILLKRGVPVKLLIVGEGEKESYLKSFCVRTELVKSVSFIGYQDSFRVRDLYVCSDIFILPAIVASNGDRDGIPNVVLEAMSVGIPVVSTTISGIPEVIQNGINGLLVPERDSEQLANAISELVNNENLRNIIVQNAFKTIQEKFESNQCNQLLIKLFEDVLYKEK